MMSNWEKKTQKNKLHCVFVCKILDRNWVVLLQLKYTYKERLVKMHVEGHYNIITSLCFVSTLCSKLVHGCCRCFKSHYHGWGFMYSES
jgi:hypothetical protein